MFCTHCGKEIKDDSKFCPFCGSQVANANRDTIGDVIDNVGEDIGKGLDDAVNEFKDTFKGSGEKISQTVEKASAQADDIKKNWRDYLTIENMEKLGALALFLPLFFGIVNTVLSNFFFGFYYIPVVSQIFRAVLMLIRMLFVVVSILAVAGMGYVLYKQESKRKVWSYVLIAFDVVAFVACLGIMCYWGTVNKVLGLLCLIYGIDAFSRHVIQKQGAESVPNVGADLKAYKTWMDDYKKANPTVDTTELATAGANNSYFDGDGITLFGLTILTTILICVTCGIAAPWMICKIMKWRKEHTVIDGRRLAFNGTGGSLFGHWILWEILTVVTCGIYSFFMYVALKRWEMQHTTYADAPEAVGQFDGNSFQYFGYGLLQTLLLLVTCCLAAPWTITMIEKWEMKHCIVGTDRMKYEGTALGLLGQYIIVLLLTIITLGIYSAWGTVRINKYIYSHTHVDR